MKIDFDRNEFCTPTRYFQEWDREFRFTLDPCATPENAKCERFFTKADNGLGQSWYGASVYCNPPFDSIPEWAEKSIEEVEDVGAFVFLHVPAWTDRRWWHKHIQPRAEKDPQHNQLRFLKSRIPYGYPGNPEHEPEQARRDGVGRGTFAAVNIILRPTIKPVRYFPMATGLSL